MNKISVPDYLRPRIIDAIENSPTHQYLQGVFATGKKGEEDSFVYTIGNRERNLPDLLLIAHGGWNDVYAEVLNILGKMQADRAKPFVDGEVVDFSAKYPALIIKANDTARSEYTVQAGQYYNTEEYEVLQVLLPDTKGIYPTNPKCDPKYKVPVLGVKTTWRMT